MEFVVWYWRRKTEVLGGKSEQVVYHIVHTGDYEEKNWQLPAWDAVWMHKYL
jgi:hypothetical protein